MALRVARGAQRDHSVSQWRRFHRNPLERFLDWILRR